MKYKIAHEDDQLFHVEHPDGSKFKVAKKGLDKKTLQKIRSLSPLHFEHGGGVPDPAQEIMEDHAQETLGRIKGGLSDAYHRLFDAPDNAGLPTPSQVLHNVYGESLPPPAPAVEPVNVASIQPPSASLPPSGEIPPAASPGGGSAAGGNAAGLDSQITGGGAANSDSAYLNKVMGPELAGIQLAAKAKSREAQAQAQAYDQYVQQSQQQLADQQAHFKALDQEQSQIVSDITNSKLDPHRLWHNAATGNKITAGLGILLSGLGQGLAGNRTPNMALSVIENAMDKDLEAQRSELGKKQSLLSANFAKYRNLDAAQSATRLQQAAILQGQIAKSAAQSGSDVAQAQALQLIGQIKRSMLPYQMELAKMRVQAQAFGVGGGQGGFSVGQEPMFLLGDKEYQQRRVQVGDRVYKHTGTEKDASEMRTFESKLPPIEDAVSRLDKLGPSAAIPGTASWNQAQAIRANLATAIAGLKSTEIGSTRINDTESHQALEAIKDPTKFTQMLSGGVRNNEFFRDLADTAEALRQQNLLGYRGMNSIQGRQPGIVK